MVAARKPEQTPTDEEELEPCIQTLFEIVGKQIRLAEKCERIQQYQNALGAYNSAVQTLVTAHQLNERLAMPEVYAQPANKRDFPFVEEDDV